MIGKRAFSAFAFALMICCTGSARAATPVDVELLLMVDVSGSIDGEEAKLQRQGYVAALTSGALREAVRAGGLGRVAMAYVEWADSTHQRLVADWTLLDDENSLTIFATRIAAAPIETGRWTALGSAIDFGVAQFTTSPFKGERRVIDISGDGYSNQGHAPGDARDKAIAAGITINGLPIVNDQPNPMGGLPPVDLDRYYQDHVIGGPGAFVLTADGMDRFGQAIMAKMVKEIAALPSRADQQMASLPRSPVKTLTFDRGDGVP